MEDFYLEEPTKERKKDAVEYINEFYKYKSDINGAGYLDKFLKESTYEEWLETLKKYKTIKKSEEHVPSRTYFLIRKNDNKIIGMINIRLELNERLKNYGGNIGYSIRPTERRKGYSKINLYLGLKICDSYNIKEVLLDADLDNIASWKTMEALKGKRIKTWKEKNGNMIVNYIIDVKEAINTKSKIYKRK